MNFIRNITTAGSQMGVLFLAIFTLKGHTTQPMIMSHVIQTGDIEDHPGESPRYRRLSGRRIDSTTVYYIIRKRDIESMLHFGNRTRDMNKQMVRRNRLHM